MSPFCTVTASRSAEPSPAAEVLHLATGRGMLPHIPHKTLLGLVPRAPDELCPGDIAVLRTGRVRVVKRLIEQDKTDGRWICMGDNENSALKTNASKVVGVVSWGSFQGRKKELLAGGGWKPRAFILFRRIEMGLLGPWVESGKGAVSAAAPSSRFLSGLLGPFRNIICRSLYGRPIATPEKESAYLLNTLRDALESLDGSPRPPLEPLDWDICLDLAIGHAVVGIVGSKWNNLPEPAGPPERVRKAIVARVRQTEKIAKLALEHAGHASAVLEARGVPMLVLKGPALAWGSYGGRTGREYGDLDILVPDSNRAEALMALKETGYRVKAGAKSEGAILRGHFHIVLHTTGGGGLTVELHWGLVDRANLFRIEHSALFNRARIVEVPGGTIRTLSAEDEFLYLCIHLCRHGIMNQLADDGRRGIGWLLDLWSGNRLLWFVDLLFCLSRRDSPVDMVKLWQRAREWNAVSEVQQCLRLLGKLFHQARAGETTTVEKRPPEVGLNWTVKGLRYHRRNSVWRWALRPLPVLVFRPLRLLQLGALFFPSPGRIKGFYGVSTRWELIYSYIRHPVSMIRRLLYVR